MINSLKENFSIQLAMKLLTFVMAIGVIVPTPFITGSQFFWGLFVITVIYNIYLIIIDFKHYIIEYKWEMLFIIACLISAAVNYNFRNIYSIVHTITTAILIFNLTTVHPRTTKEKFEFETKFLDYLLIIFTFVIGLISIYFFITNPINILQGERFEGLYLNSNQLGFWAFISIILSYKYIDNKFNIINIILELVLIVLAGSRSVFIALSIFILYLLFKKVGKINNKNKSLILLGSILAITILVVISTLTRYQWLYKYISDINFESIFNVLSGYRYFIWKQELEIFIHYPIFGVGVNNLNNAARLVLPPDSVIISGGWEDPHNIIIGLLGYTGIVGTTLFIKIIYDKFKLSISNKLDYITFTMICLLIIALFDIGIVFDNRILSVYFWYVIGQINCIKFIKGDKDVKED